MEIKKIKYGGWNNCYRLANKLVEVVVTSDVGPRIIRYSFLNGDNEFCEYENQLGKTKSKEWMIYGGHRLWHAPEARPRSYSPDNNPVEVKIEKFTIKLTQPVELSTGIQKEIEVTLDKNSTMVTVLHRLTNKNLWPIELSIWALSVMAKGGFAIIPREKYVPHTQSLLPTMPLVLWSYTDMSDKRWKWGKKYLILHQDECAKNPQKIGARVLAGWAAYSRKNNIFVKFFDYKKDANYPDFGCTVETFTNEDMLELETLGPLTKLEPDASVEHIEKWFLLGKPNIKPIDESIDSNVLPFISNLKKTIVS
ncbi:MAG: hypothetical protein AABY84_09705 [Candidatus Firestonebacteria bacterium]